MAKTRHHLIMPDPLRSRIKASLSQTAEDRRECFLSLLCSVHRVGSTRRLLPRYLLIPDEGCYKVRNSGFVALDERFDDLMLSMAQEEQLAVVHFHTHLGRGFARFSGFDDDAELKRSVAIKREIGVIMASVVANENGDLCESRVWINGGEIPMLIKDPDELSRPTSSGVQSAIRYDRQVRGFGEELQRSLSALRVGVIGLGGLGSHLVQQLAHLGVRRFTLVDPDRAEETNLNRLIGAQRSDVAGGSHKVEIARRVIFALHGPEASVKCVTSDVKTRKATEALAACDFIISATDNQSSRLAAQELALAYLRPLMNVGVHLSAEGGEIKQILGRVTAPKVGYGDCLICRDVVDVEAASKERADKATRAALRARGYLKDTPAPAVVWVNGLVASRAVGLLQELVIGWSRVPERDLLIDIYRDESMSFEAPDSDCPLCSASGISGSAHRLFEYRRGGTDELPVLDLEARPAESASEEADEAEPAAEHAAKSPLESATERAPSDGETDAECALSSEESTAESGPSQGESSAELSSSSDESVAEQGSSDDESSAEPTPSGDESTSESVQSEGEPPVKAPRKRRKRARKSADLVS